MREKDSNSGASRILSFYFCFFFFYFMRLLIIKMRTFMRGQFYNEQKYHLSLIKISSSFKCHAASNQPVIGFSMKYFFVELIPLSSEHILIDHRKILVEWRKNSARQRLSFTCKIIRVNGRTVAPLRIAALSALMAPQEAAGTLCRSEFCVRSP